METKARLHPKWVGGRDGYRYSVIYGGLLVERSRDPETDAARALLAQGITGKLTLCDGKTGVPRTTIDIEKAAGLRTVEESAKGLRVKPYREMGSGEGYSLETEAGGMGYPSLKKGLLNE